MTAPNPITIVGGGLAGLSLGIALRNAGVPTKIFEAGEYPRHRVCGEFVTGLDDATIGKLGIGPAFEGAGSHRSVTWFSRERMIGRIHLPSPARALSRHALDARLAGLFTKAGGELLTKTRFTASAHLPGWVQASGRKRFSESPWMGLKVHARNLETTDDLELHFGDGAYVGLSSVEDGWINVCGLFRRHLGLHFDRDEALTASLHASGLHALAERLKTAIIQPGSRCAVAAFAFDRGIADADTGVLLGDACAMVPPFTGNGMAMAFTSAALALDPLMEWAQGRRPWEETAQGIRKVLRDEFRLRLATASFVHPFLLNPTLQLCVSGAMRAGLLPTTTLYRLLH